MPAAARVSVAALAAALFATDLRAQAVLPEVTISATRSERDPFDLPVSIDTVDARAIGEANRLVNLSEVLAQVPGIAVQDRQNYAQDLQISSRGFGAQPRSACARCG